MAKQKKVTINGDEFVLQHPGVRWYISLTDDCKNQFAVLQNEEYLDKLFENVVVDPQGLSLDSFGPDKEYPAAIMKDLKEEIETFLNT